ncbi:MAG: hypothetical protein ACPLUI_09890 [Desulfofundulus sp.]
MLQRYCELMEELSVLEQSLLADLSTDEIMRYLNLRREQEELSGELGNLVLDALLHLQDLSNRITEELVDLSGLMKNTGGHGGNRGNYLPRFARVVGALETEMERILADCRQLRYELLWGEEKEINKESVLRREQVQEEIVVCRGEDGQDSKKQGTQEEKYDTVAGEVACTLEVAQSRETFPPGGLSQNDGGYTEGETGKNIKSNPLSPETVKKIETVLRPREVMEIKPLIENQVLFNELKIASAGEGKMRNGKSQKGRNRR